MRVRFSPSSLADLDAILAYISERSPHGAGKVKARIRAVTEMIAIYPFAGVVTDESGIRCIAASPFAYLVYYEPFATEVIIRAVMHDARERL